MSCKSNTPGPQLQDQLLILGISLGGAGHTGGCDEAKWKAIIQTIKTQIKRKLTHEGEGQDPSWHVNKTEPKCKQSD